MPRPFGATSRFPCEKQGISLDVLECGRKTSLTVEKPTKGVANIAKMSYQANMDGMVFLPRTSVRGQWAVFRQRRWNRESLHTGPWTDSVFIKSPAISG